MDEFSNYQWYKDDYEKDRNEPVIFNSSQSYYTENYTKKKNKNNLLLNNLIVALISVIVGGLVLGTTFAFLNPIINPQPDVPKLAEEPSAGTSGGQDIDLTQQKGTAANGANSGNVNALAPTPVTGTEESRMLTVPQINRKVGPAVVGVVSKVQSRGFWGDIYETEGSGSGIIISSDGFIVTNNHVIEGANEITVILNGAQVQNINKNENDDERNRFKAKVVGADPKTDLAVLKIDATGLPFAKLGDSSQLEVGEMAVAIGNPLGMEFQGSVTVGVISALNRTIQVDDREFTLIQTDAAINPGNSGGALVNSRGEVIGINTIKIKISGVEGMGFAIPINEAKPIIEDLQKYGYVKGRPLIGIAGRDVTSVVAQQYNWPMGIYVIEVTPFSGAELGGIRPGDIITKFNGKRVKTMAELNEMKEKLQVGTEVKVEVYRDGETKVFTIKLTEARS